jgi:hypothetical protein
MPAAVVLLSAHRDGDRHLAAAGVCLTCATRTTSEIDLPRNIAGLYRVSGCYRHSARPVTRRWSAAEFEEVITEGVASHATENIGHLESLVTPPSPA